MPELDIVYFTSDNSDEVFGIKQQDLVGTVHHDKQPGQTYAAEV
jgi:hypothetical protein